jgi:hypothetical protein
LSPLDADRFSYLVHFWQWLCEESLALDCSFYHMRCDHRYPSLFTITGGVQWLLDFHRRPISAFRSRNDAGVHQHSTK